MYFSLHTFIWTIVDSCLWMFPWVFKQNLQSDFTGGSKIGNKNRCFAMLWRLSGNRTTRRLLQSFFCFCFCIGCKKSRRFKWIIMPIKISSIRRFSLLRQWNENCTTFNLIHWRKSRSRWSCGIFVNYMNRFSTYDSSYVF